MIRRKVHFFPPSTRAPGPVPRLTEAIDIAVIGGGPAASGAARLLASWGHVVTVVPGPGRRGLASAESLPPTIRKPLTSLGLHEAVEGAGFVETRGNSAAWEGDELRSVDFGDPAGFQVERDRLDRVLLRAAEGAGARILHGARARSVSIDPAPATGRGTIYWDGPAGSGTLHPRWVLDGSGRAGVVARHVGRIPFAGPSTLALIGVWSRPGGWSLPDPSHTVVEAYTDGWIWSVPVSNGSRYVAAMIDPRRPGFDRSAALEATYRREIHASRHVRSLLDGATLEHGPSASIATPYTSARFAGDGYLLIGDAASFIDPLSSFGVKKALASAFLAAVATHSALTRPEMTDHALSLFRDRETEAYRRYSDHARRYYALAAPRFETDFWATRGLARPSNSHSEASPPAEEEPDIDSPEAALPIRHSDSRVRSALDRLRRVSTLRLSPGPGVRFVSGPTISGRQVTLEERVSAPSLTTSLRFHRGIDLTRLVRIAASAEDVGSLHAAYLESGHPAPLPDFLSALACGIALDVFTLLDE